MWRISHSYIRVALTATEDSPSSRSIECAMSSSDLRTNQSVSQDGLAMGSCWWCIAPWDGGDSSVDQGIPPKYFFRFDVFVVTAVAINESILRWILLMYTINCSLKNILSYSYTQVNRAPYIMTRHPDFHRAASRAQGPCPVRLWPSDPSQKLRDVSSIGTTKRTLWQLKVTWWKYLRCS